MIVYSKKVAELKRADEEAARKAKVDAKGPAKAAPKRIRPGDDESEDGGSKKKKGDGGGGGGAGGGGGGNAEQLAEAVEKLRDMEKAMKLQQQQSQLLMELMMKQMQQAQAGTAPSFVGQMPMMMAPMYTSQPLALASSSTGSKPKAAGGGAVGKGGRRAGKMDGAETERAADRDEDYGSSRGKGAGGGGARAGAAAKKSAVSTGGAAIAPAASAVIQSLTDVEKNKLINDVESLTEEEQNRIMQFLQDRGQAKEEADGTTEYDLENLGDAVLRCAALPSRANAPPPPPL